MSYESSPIPTPLVVVLTFVLACEFLTPFDKGLDFVCILVRLMIQNKRKDVNKMKRRYSRQEYNNAFIKGIVVGMLLMALANVIRIG